jgi:hypothetical protein
MPGKLVELVKEENQFKEHQRLGDLWREASGFDRSIDLLNKAEQHNNAAYEAVQRTGKQDFTINMNFRDILLR